MRAVRFWIAGLLVVAVAGCGVSSRRGVSRLHRLAGVADAVSGCAARGANLSAMSFPAADVGWAVATVSLRSGTPIGSEILGTRDAGGNWSCQWRGSLAPVQLVATDPAHAWMLGWRGSGCEDALALPHCRSVVLGSGDRVDWSVLSEPGQGVTQLAFASPTLGLAAARDRACTEPQGLPPAHCAGQVLLTDDGGRHWRAVLHTADPIVAVAIRRGVLWAVESHLGIASESSGRRPGLIVLTSHDGGGSWRTVGRVGLWMAGLREQVQLVVGPSGGLWLSVFDQDGCAMHGCSPDDLWRSDDGGLRWTRTDPVDQVGRSRPPDCGPAGPIPFALGRAGSLWAAEALPTASCEGPAATLLRRSAGGRWAVVRRWASFSPTGLAWPTKSVGYILGPSGLARSTNAGRTWTQVLPAPRPTAALDPDTTRRVSAAGEPTDQGAVLATGDGGASWRVTGELPIDVTELGLARSGAGFALGTRWIERRNRPIWQFFVHRRGRPSWRLRSTLPLRADQSVDGLWMAGSRRGLMLVASGAAWPENQGGIAPVTLWQTDSGGRSWRALRRVPLAGRQTLGSASFTRAGSSWDGWLVDSAGLRATTDAGASWHRLPSAPSLDGVDRLSGSFGVGWSGPQDGRIRLWRTVDGGHDWSRVPLPTALAAAENPNGASVDVAFVNPQVGWVLVDGAIWRTTDAGRTWRQLSRTPLGGF